MKAVLRLTLLLLVAALALVAAWRIAVTGIDRPEAHAEPPQAVAVQPRPPAALLQQARQLVVAGRLDQAARSARQLLREAPLQAGALVVLARVTAQRDDDAQHLFQVALQRAPRNQYARAWMIGTQLQQGDFHAALANIGTLLLFAPPRRDLFIPIMVRLAGRADFAAALVDALQRHPPWRSDLLRALLDQGKARAVASVYQGLADANDLGLREKDAWLRHLMRAGRWGEAYSRWASGLLLAGGSALPMLYNGGFERPILGLGFGWRAPAAVGVLLQRVQRQADHAIKLVFLGRRVPRAGLAQTLLLRPGRYRLTFRARARNVQSDQGLSWRVSCHGDTEMQRDSPRMQGSFDWKALQVLFVVPQTGCPAQELALVNPGAVGPGKIVSGTLWFDQFVVAPLAAGHGTTGPVALGGDD